MPSNQNHCLGTSVPSASVGLQTVPLGSPLTSIFALNSPAGTVDQWGYTPILPSSLWLQRTLPAGASGGPENMTAWGWNRFKIPPTSGQ